MFIIDAHLDLSMNALEWNRDLTQTVQVINARESGLTDKPDRAKAVVSLPDLRRGKVGLVVATQIARYVAPGNTLPGWHSPEQAWAQTQGQLAWYKAMEKKGEMVQINNVDTLNKHIALWKDEEIVDSPKPIGYILSLEGADSLVTLDHLHEAYAAGLRAVGPAHYGPGRYAQGTDATGFMGEQGKALLREMEKLGVILDATHLCDDSFWEALDHFDGAIWASHNNCRSLVNHNRQYSDEQIRALIARGAVIGGALDAWMMVPNWKRGISTPQNMGCNLEVLVDHLDHICQLAGNAKHIGIGSDLDGAFGREQCPYDLETIADLQLLVDILARRGYSPADIEGIMHNNWLSFLQKTWKA
ncbi:membrane dipeptidase [Sphingobacterium oryzagri]|uniref:Membrane dipeptidase n=1 Tax=Sphingobacterium oryzagri TaxID=3025669 RepID=A0ABY7WCM3_9SPHI|nr:membrane dipeptidase [Sphingobacterium sp. KACC 22765]WDF67416.1 membrane dipeptidase [Sphingobacterium sp. KACC 22765]